MPDKEKRPSGAQGAFKVGLSDRETGRARLSITTEADWLIQETLSVAGTPQVVFSLSGRGKGLGDPPGTGGYAAFFNICFSRAVMARR